MSVKNGFFAGSVLVLAVAVAFAGCAGVSGTLRRNAETTKQFETAQILPGHSYYWSGIEDVPDGILAVADGFTLKSVLWNEFDPGNGKLKEMVGRMQEKGHYTSRFAFGSIIYGDDGRKIGVWYSQADWTTVVMHESNTVEITTPGKIIMDRDRGRGSTWGR